MDNRNIISALIGLTGAISNNGKSENTDSIIIEALLSKDSDSIMEKLRKEKYAISPDCENCKTPCGNTSDYDMDKYDMQPGEIKKIKEDIISELKRIAEFYKNKEELPEICIKAISHLGYELKIESYRNLMEELKDVKTNN